jgi:hypothetical protein
LSGGDQREVSGFVADLESGVPEQLLAFPAHDRPVGEALQGQPARGGREPFLDALPFQLALLGLDLPRRIDAQGQLVLAERGHRVAHQVERGADRITRSLRGLVLRRERLSKFRELLLRRFEATTAHGKCFGGVTGMMIEECELISPVRSSVACDLPGDRVPHEVRNFFPSRIEEANGPRVRDLARLELGADEGIGTTVVGLRQVYAQLAMG